MSIINCPKCGKETNSVWVDPDGDGCYLIPVPDENGVLFWRRGCIPKDKLNPYFVHIALQSKDKPCK